MRFQIFLFAMLVVGLTAGLFSRSLKVEMKALNDSQQNGTATISRAANNHLKVTISLENEPAGAREPAHIHPGTCADLNPVPTATLEDVVDGKSVSTIPAPSSTPGARAIVVHKGPGDEMNTYVSCGNITH